MCRVHSAEDAVWHPALVAADCGVEFQCQTQSGHCLFTYSVSQRKPESWAGQEKGSHGLMNKEMEHVVMQRHSLRAILEQVGHGARQERKQRRK